MVLSTICSCNAMRLRQCMSLSSSYSCEVALIMPELQLGNSCCLTSKSSALIAIENAQTILGLCEL